MSSQPHAPVTLNVDVVFGSSPTATPQGSSVGTGSDHDDDGVNHRDRAGGENVPNVDRTDSLAPLLVRRSSSTPRVLLAAAGAPGPSNQSDDAKTIKTAWIAGGLVALGVIIFLVKELSSAKNGVPSLHPDATPVPSATLIPASPAPSSSNISNHTQTLTTMSKEPKSTLSMLATISVTLTSALLSKTATVLSSTLNQVATRTKSASLSVSNQSATDTIVPPPAPTSQPTTQPQTNQPESPAPSPAPHHLKTQTETKPVSPSALNQTRTETLWTLSHSENATDTNSQSMTPASGKWVTVLAGCTEPFPSADAPPSSVTVLQQGDAVSCNSSGFFARIRSVVTGSAVMGQYLANVCQNAFNTTLCAQVHEDTIAQEAMKACDSPFNPNEVTPALGGKTGAGLNGDGTEEEICAAAMFTVADFDKKGFAAANCALSPSGGHVIGCNLNP